MASSEPAKEIPKEALPVATPPPEKTIEIPEDLPSGLKELMQKLDLLKMAKVMLDQTKLEEKEVAPPVVENPLTAAHQQRANQLASMKEAKLKEGSKTDAKPEQLKPPEVPVSLIQHYQRAIEDKPISNPDPLAQPIEKTPESLSHLPAFFQVFVQALNETGLMKDLLPSLHPTARKLFEGKEVPTVPVGELDQLIHRFAELKESPEKPKEDVKYVFLKEGDKVSVPSIKDLLKKGLKGKSEARDEKEEFPEDANVLLIQDLLKKGLNVILEKIAPNSFEETQRNLYGMFKYLTGASEKKSGNEAVDGFFQRLGEMKFQGGEEEEEDDDATERPPKYVKIAHIGTPEPSFDVKAVEDALKAKDHLLFEQGRVIQAYRQRLEAATDQLKHYERQMKVHTHQLDHWKEYAGRLYDQLDHWKEYAGRLYEQVKANADEALHQRFPPPGDRFRSFAPCMRCSRSPCVNERHGGC